ncbi:hypothetical protein [Mycobacterium sp. pW045]|uniref:hypothetical protein n=1 Tax=Mycobacterium sp. pW045 TaxID=3238984 RepID=UPI00351B1480
MTATQRCCSGADFHSGDCTAPVDVLLESAYTHAVAAAAAMKAARARLHERGQFVADITLSAAAGIGNLR